MTLLEEATQALSDLPPEKQNEVLNFIHFLREQIQKKSEIANREERSKQIMAAFQSLSESGAFADIEDPVAWQREIRKDRALPGREAQC